MIHCPTYPAFHRAYRLLEPVGNVAVRHSLIVGERNALALLAAQMFETIPETLCLRIVVPVILLIVLAGQKRFVIRRLAFGSAGLPAAQPVNTAIANNMRKPVIGVLSAAL